MHHLHKLWPFVKPYWRRCLAALFLLTSLVFMDLAIPRLIQRLIDQGINQQNGTVVLQTSLLMLGISALSTVFAVGNNIFSVQVGEGVARDLREATYSPDPGFLLRQSRPFHHRQTAGAPDQRRQRGAAAGADLPAHRHPRPAADDRQPDPDVCHRQPNWRSPSCPCCW